MRRVEVILGVVAGLLVAGAAATTHPAEAQEPVPQVTIGPGVAAESADPTRPTIPCKPPTFPGPNYTGPCFVHFPVTVEPPAPVTITIQFRVGTAGHDDVTTPLVRQTMTYGVGGDCFCLVVADDDIPEGDEGLSVDIGLVVGGELSAEQRDVTVTILDDESPVPAPSVSAVAAGPSWVTLAWDEVRSLRSLRSAYEITATDQADPGNVVLRRVQFDVHQVTVDGLRPGTYDFTVRALTTLDGPGSPGSATAATDADGPVATAPDAPTIAVSAPGDGFVDVAWQPSVNDNGAPLVAFSVVAVGPDGQVAAWRNVMADVRWASLTGLANDVPVDVYVLAWNAVGARMATEPVSLTPAATGPAPRPPESPLYLEVRGHEFSPRGGATVTWGAAAPEHGEPVLGYSVVVSWDTFGDGIRLIRWINVGPDVRTVEIDDLPSCEYDVFVIPHTASGFAAPAYEPGVDIPRPTELPGCINPS